VAASPTGARVDERMPAGTVPEREVEKALFFLGKALELSPENGLYFYGRGRVSLLSGDKENAIEDFKRAAALGNRDARAHSLPSVQFRIKLCLTFRA